MHGVEPEDDEERAPDQSAAAKDSGAQPKPSLEATGDARPSEAADKNRDQPEDESDEPVRSRDEQAHPDTIVAQFVITPESPLEGRSVRQYRLGEHYRLAVVGLRPVRAGKGFSRKEIADRTIGAGDILLVQGSEEQLLAAQRDGIG